MLKRIMRSLPRLSKFIFTALIIGAFSWSSVYAFGVVSPPNISNKPSSPVGKIESAKGKVWGLTANNSKKTRRKGDVIIMNDVISTGYKSSSTIRFIDHSTMKLGADASITIDEMVYDLKDHKADSVVFHLSSGAFYFISGKVAKKHVLLITPTATIGIRGTELLISVDNDGSTSVGVTKGRAYMRSRNNSSKTDIDLGSTARSDAKGNIGKAHKGVDMTGDEGVDRNVKGLSDWHDEGVTINNGGFTDFGEQKNDNKDYNGTDGEGGDGSGSEGGDSEFDGAENVNSDGLDGEGDGGQNGEGDGSGAGSSEGDGSGAGSSDSGGDGGGSDSGGDGGEGGSDSGGDGGGSDSGGDGGGSDSGGDGGHDSHH